MNGPEHYAEAERIRKAIRTPRDASEQGFDGWQRDDLIALGQLHATLALAAATACSVQLEGDPVPAALHADAGWEAVLGYSSLRRSPVSL